MQNRWDTAFTIVELIITIVVISVLVTISIIGYNGVTKLALSTAAQSDLQQVAALMERELQRHKTYPETLPSEFHSSNRVSVSLSNAGKLPYYESLSPVQSGVLFADVCENLVEEGYGKGTSQGGQVRDYITGCGNWNDDSMQFTGWDTKVWNTPVQKQAMQEYADKFNTVGWDADQTRVTKTFYKQLVGRFEQQGGKFPINSFWDYWATPENGGVMHEPLDANAPVRPYYCAEAIVPQYTGLTWHITQKGRLEAGSC